METIQGWMALNPDHVIAVTGIKGGSCDRRFCDLDYGTKSYTFDPLRHLAGVTPPSDNDSAHPHLDPVGPQGCNVTRAGYLIRHAAIHTSSYEYAEFLAPFFWKLENSTVDWSIIPNLAFLSTWRNPILSSDQEMLSRSGKLQAMSLGVELAQRYYYLRTPPKIWAASSDRTMQSAQFFMKGLAVNAPGHEVVKISEDKTRGANTLAPDKSCPVYAKSDGAVQASEYLKIYTKPVIERFDSIAPGFNFTASDIYAMSLICGYETVLRGSSPFCGLSVLTPNEWLGFEYTNDLKYFYNSGYGSPISGAAGFPWVNATFNALMSKHDTQSNKTEDQDLFVSFAHRALPPMILVALDLFNNSAFSGANQVLSTMPLNTINYQRVWKSSSIIPFMTDIGIEKMECDSFGFDAGTYYRVIVNHSPQSLNGCNDGPAESCKEETLVGWLAGRAKVVGDFDTTCKVNYGNYTNHLEIYRD
ncbi:hypothetical protein K3495_g14015 [Podosphaera aphanis]|nr:hypothetical protein K3495_g14015 [Podosphaera aphanis]